MSKIFKLPIFKQFYDRYLNKREKALKNNREEVLMLYRYLLKKIPPTIENPLDRKKKLEVNLKRNFFLINNKQICL